MTELGIMYDSNSYTFNKPDEDLVTSTVVIVVVTVICIETITIIK